MFTPINQKEIQRRTLQLTTFEDGLWDILTGAIFLLLGIYPITRNLLGPQWNLLLFLLVLLVFLGLHTLAKHRYFEPRLGVVKMRPVPAKIFIVVLVGLLVIVSMAFVLAFARNPGTLQDTLKDMPEWINKFGIDLLASILIMVIYNLMGYLFGVPRLYLYGWLIGFGNLTSVILTHDYGFSFNLPLVVAAGIILVIGVVLFIRFIHKYQLYSEDQDTKNV